MKIAVFGDIHSNCFALTSLMRVIDTHNVDHLIITGDIFGYYPWAFKTYSIISKLRIPYTCIKGNHDQLILDKIKNSELKLPVSYWTAIEQNTNQLQSQSQQAISWLNSLDCKAEFKSDNLMYHIYHGTPDDPLNGRFYPDNIHFYDWFPKDNSVIILGHTHYPIIRKLETGGIIINPGSVGQPRDGKIDPAWILIDEETMDINLMRFNYNINEIVEKLHKMDWDQRAIKALKKSLKGELGDDTLKQVKNVR